MKYTTTRFGEIEFREDTALEFPEGIIGFEGYSKYVILGDNDNSMFCWLQSLENPDLAFVIVCPYDFMKNYSFEVSNPDVEFLSVTDNKALVVYAIVVIPEDPSKMTANLQAPLVINSSNRKGRQVVSLNPSHKLRHMILEEMQQKYEKKEQA